MKVLENINYAGCEDQLRRLDVYIPDGEVKGSVLFLHAGGLDHGSRKNVAEYMGIVDAGYAFISADYRLYPDTEYPSFLVDAAQAAQFTHRMAPDWGIPAELFISGASAGAWQTMMLAVDRTYLADDSFVKGYISESAQVFAHYIILEHRGMDRRLEVINETAPIGYLKPGLRVKPVLLMSYSNDLKCRPEENRLMFASMQNLMPEGHVEYKELEGTHIHPVRIEDRVNAYVDFMDRIG